MCNNKSRASKCLPMTSQTNAVEKIQPKAHARICFLISSSFHFFVSHLNNEWLNISHKCANANGLTTGNVIIIIIIIPFIELEPEHTFSIFPPLCPSLSLCAFHNFHALISPHFTGIPFLCPKMVGTRNEGRQRGRKQNKTKDLPNYGEWINCMSCGPLAAAAVWIHSN